MHRNAKTPMFIIITPAELKLDKKHRRVCSFSKPAEDSI